MSPELHFQITDMLSISMSPLSVLGHPKYRSQAAVPKLGSHLGNSLKRKILGLHSSSSSLVGLQ